MTIPAPESEPAAIAEALSAARIPATVTDGFDCSISAAMAAAWGTAAEVPKNGLKDERPVVTPSAAAKSGLLSSRPPDVLKRTLPGVIAVPSGWKNRRRGPALL